MRIVHNWALTSLASLTFVRVLHELSCFRFFHIIAVLSHSTPLYRKMLNSQFRSSHVDNRMMLLNWFLFRNRSIYLHFIFHFFIPMRMKAGLDDLSGFDIKCSLSLSHVLNVQRNRGREILFPFKTKFACIKSFRLSLLLQRKLSQAKFSSFSHKYFAMYNLTI